MKPKPPIRVVDGYGCLYTLVSEEVETAPGMFDLERYERTDPPDPTHWYRRSLASRTYTDNKPLMIPYPR